MTRRLVLLFLACVLVACVLAIVLEDPPAGTPSPTVTEAPR